MTGITVEEVVRTAEELLNETQPDGCPAGQLGEQSRAGRRRASGGLPGPGRNHHRGSGVPGRPGADPVRPGAQEALRALRASGYRLIVVTNQAGVARGLITEADVRRVNQRLQELLADAGVALDAIYYCPHHPEAGSPEYRQACTSRKPGPGMIERARRDFALDLGRS